MLYNFAYLCYDSAGFTRLGSKKFRKGKTTMKKTLAIVLALAMVLCMIPAAFAAQTKTITDKSYDLKVESYGPMDKGNPSTANASKANSITFKYNYEEEGVDVTGKFTEDKKMALVTVAGFDADLGTLTASEVTVTVDGKDLQVNDSAAYAGSIGWKTVDSKAAVVFPVELTKAGYTDSYVITVKGKVGDVEITETAKISLTLKNGADYKTAKTATITGVSTDKKVLDAYIVGSKIYLDFVANNPSGTTDEQIKLTFADENGAKFSVVTWAYKSGIFMPQKKGAPAADGVKLDKSAANFRVENCESANGKKVTFKLETANAIYETKEYTVVTRTGIVEADPKGIYFAESTKTIKVGESYTPVVMGIATGKKVDAKVTYGKDGQGTKVNAQYVDVEDGATVIGTQEGVAYITASYKTNNGVEYVASSMKIVVAGAAEVAPAGTTTYYVTCRNLNVRKGAGTSYAKAGMLHRGDKVEVVSISKNWAKLANGTYVSAKYIAK